MKSDDCGYERFADIWSLGCTVFEMLSGESPFVGRNFLECVNKVLGFKEKNFVFPEYFSVFAKDFILCCLKKHPFERKNVAKLLKHPFLKEGRNEGDGFRLDNNSLLFQLHEQKLKKLFKDKIVNKKEDKKFVKKKEDDFKDNFDNLDFKIKSQETLNGYEFGKGYNDNNLKEKIISNDLKKNNNSISNKKEDNKKKVKIKKKNLKKIKIKRKTTKNKEKALINQFSGRFLENDILYQKFTKIKQKFEKKSKDTILKTSSESEKKVKKRKIINLHKKRIRDFKSNNLSSNISPIFKINQKQKYIKNFNFQYENLLSPKISNLLSPKISPVFNPYRKSMKRKRSSHYKEKEERFRYYKYSEKKNGNKKFDFCI